MGNELIGYKEMMQLDTNQDEYIPKERDFTSYESTKLCHKPNNGNFNVMKPLLLIKNRFMPSDKEVIKDLLKKLTGQPLLHNCIIETELYGQDPPWIVLRDDHEQLPWHKSPSGDKGTIYVLTKLKMLGPVQVARSAGCGLWHTTSTLVPIKDDDGAVIGVKRRLTFVSQDQKLKPVKGHWLMQEYSLAGSSLSRDKGKCDYVVCKITRDDSKKKTAVARVHNQKKGYHQIYNEAKKTEENLHSDSRYESSLEVTRKRRFFPDNVQHSIKNTAFDTANNDISKLKDRVKNEMGNQQFYNEVNRIRETMQFDTGYASLSRERSKYRRCVSILEAPSSNGQKQSREVHNGNVNFPWLSTT